MTSPVAVGEELYDSIKRISTLIFTLYRVRTSHPGTSGDKQREAIFDRYDFKKRTPTTITDGHCSRAN